MSQTKKKLGSSCRLNHQNKLHTFYRVPGMVKCLANHPCCNNSDYSHMFIQHMRDKETLTKLTKQQLQRCKKQRGTIFQQLVGHSKQLPWPQIPAMRCGSKTSPRHGLWCRSQPVSFFPLPKLYIIELYLSYMCRQVKK